MTIVGVDEVGRGCWAGPLVAGAAILPMPLAGLRDSKQLRAAERERLAAQLHETAHIGLGWVKPSEVDEHGLTAAVRLAMERAVAALNRPYDRLVVDGNYNFLAHVSRTEAVVKADATVPAVSAASIVAKVARDHYMAEQALQYPGFGFEKHVGYGTAFHLQKLHELGITPLHRRSYKPVKALLH